MPCAVNQHKCRHQGFLKAASLGPELGIFLPLRLTLRGAEIAGSAKASRKARSFISGHVYMTCQSIDEAGPVQPVSNRAPLVPSKALQVIALNVEKAALDSPAGDAGDAGVRLVAAIGDG